MKTPVTLENKTIFITGSAGFIGANLVKRLMTLWPAVIDGPAWVMPKSHWAFELDHGNGGWLGPALRAVGVDLPGRLPVTMQVNDSLVSLQAAEAGEGLALGWRITADRALAQGRVMRALPDTLTTDRYFHILTPKAARPRRVVRQFCDWLAAQDDPPAAQLRP